MVKGITQFAQKIAKERKKKNVQKPPPKKEPQVRKQQQHPTKAKLFKCSECEYANKDLGLVTNHVKIAHKKPFKCGSCDYTNSSKEEVLKHIQV